MPIPQVNDRLKEAPVVVLRAVFAGIGQILLTADKVRARAAEQTWMPDRAAEHPPADLSTDEPAPQPAKATPTRNTTVTATTTPAANLTPKATQPTSAAPAATTRPAAKSTPATKSTAAAKSAAAAKSTRAAKAAPAANTRPTVRTGPPTRTTAATKSAPVTKAAKAGPARTAPATEAAPVPGYDDLSLASLRGRLRALDPATIRATLAYEKAHARREQVITMLERRLEKITAG